jgi:hypothetical protein
MADNRRTSEYRKLLPFIARASGDVGEDTIGEDVQALLQALEAHKTSDDHDDRYYTEWEITSLLSYKADKAITLTAGLGLTGGGDLSADRRFDVGAGDGIAVGADDVRVDLSYNFDWSGVHSFNNITYASSIMPHLSEVYDLGSSTNLWRKIFASELSAIVFAQYEQVLLGGWFTVSKGEGVLPQAVSAEDTKMDLGSGAFATNDILVFRGISSDGTPQVEYMRVGEIYISSTVYNVTRDLDGSGANNWPAGTVFGNWGQAGNGRIELNAYDTPRLSVFSHGAAIADFREQVRIGDLINGWGYSTSTYGSAFGAYETGKANITIDPTNGVRIRNYNQTIIQLTGTEASFENVIKLGTYGRLQQGSGTWGIDFTGSAIWSEGSPAIMNIGGWNNNVKQWWGGSDGSLYAGGGDVILNKNGIAIRSVIGEEWAKPYSLKFQAIGSTEFVMAKIWAAKNYGTIQTNNLRLETETDNATYGTSIFLAAHKTVGSSADDASLIISSKVGTSTTSWIQLNANRILFQGNVQADNNLVVDGTIKDGSGVEYLKSDDKAADSDKLDGKTYAQLMLSIYPVGSIYMSVNSTNPGTLFGGTWAAWGAGRVPVGINTSDANFNTVEKTGGAKTHAHGLSAGFAKLALSTDNWLAIARKYVTTWTKTHKMTGTVTGETTTIAVGTELGGNTDSDSSLQPYIVCYMWKRTA